MIKDRGRELGWVVIRGVCNMCKDRRAFKTRMAMMHNQSVVK